jgi:hypothetical protein
MTIRHREKGRLALLKGREGACGHQITICIDARHRAREHIASWPGRMRLSAGSRPRAIPMIVDADMSSDDIMALTYLLERADVRVRAITVEGTGVADGRPGALNVLRLVRALGIRQHITVAFGPPHPWMARHPFRAPGEPLLMACTG